MGLKFLPALAVCALLGHGAAVHAAGTGAAPEASAAQAAASARFPAIRILAPKEGARVGPAIVLDFETPADLPNMTMSAKEIGVHLHIGIDDTSLMPEMQDLKRIGKNRYRYRFDLPAEPGTRVLSVYWSDAKHRTIEATVRRVKVTVVPAKEKK
jgi:hypothetical protein